MYAIIGILCVIFFVAGFALCSTAIKWRLNIALGSLLAGCCGLVSACFFISGAVGFFSLSGVLLLIALLLGYDTRG
jgi:hypothetical protein